MLLFVAVRCCSLLFVAVRGCSLCSVVFRCVLFLLCSVVEIGARSSNFDFYGVNSKLLGNISSIRVKRTFGTMQKEERAL